jgi:hypothetical protein
MRNRKANNLLFAAWMAFCVSAGAARADDQITLAKPGPADRPGDWIFLDNGQIRLGVKKTSGAAIGYLSPSGSKKNLLNHLDHGRLVQQSYYGDPDGSRWDKQPWRWNPVQGGDWQGRASELLESRADENALYAKVQPRHWASGEKLTDVVMEERIDLQGRVAHVVFTMTYRGEKRHGRTSQEVPAFFAEPEFSTLALYDGPQPWTGGALNRTKPGWPNETRRMTEHWAAYLDERNFGVGAYVPIADHLTCYRYQAGKSSCSYFAPLIEMAITPGVEFKYDLYLTVGNIEDIRATFHKIAAEPGAGKGNQNRR